MFRRLLTAAGLLLVLGLPSVPAIAFAADNSPSGTSTPGSETGVGIRLLDVPAATQTDPRARSYIVDNLAPGTTIHRRVEVQNNTNSAQTVQVYAGAAHIQDNSFVGEDGAAKNALTTWTSLDHPALTMAPGGKADVVATIAVPADAPEGEQYAAIWAEVRAPADPKTHIVSASRAGVRVYLSVGPGNGPAADFSITSVTASRDKTGAPSIDATVTNSGGRALDLSGTVMLTAGPGGLSAGPFPTPKTITLTPGSQGSIPLALSTTIPDGPWTATVTLHSGLITHTATTQLTFPQAGQSNNVPVSANPLIPGWLLVMIAAIALSGAGVLLWFLLRRRRNRPQNHRAEVTP